MEEEAKKEETQEAKPEDLKDLKERLEKMTATELREMGSWDPGPRWCACDEEGRTPRGD